jgi:hypothetical protein
MPETFVDQDLRGARFDRCLLNDAVLRGVDVSGMEIDAPWLTEGKPLLVNGVDVTPYVEAELERRFPGREGQRAATADALRVAWADAERAWSATVERAPRDLVDVRVDGEWSFSQTLRHLVMATDVWLRGAILRVEHPFHPLGQPFAEYAADGYDLSVFEPGIPSYARVLAARADRVGQVRDFLTALTDDSLVAPCPHPWAPDRDVTTLHCLQTILHEEWEHLRFALRDLDRLPRE